MTIGSDWRGGERGFLQIIAMVLVLSASIRSGAAEDHPNTHNMLVFGEQIIFLSHLPMFKGVNGAGNEFTSPHRYQVILEAAVTKEQLDRYVKDRQAHPGTRYYTIGPEQEFVLSRLFTPESAPQLTSFTATVYRGHLEVPQPNPVPGLENIPIKVNRIVHARKFDPQGEKPATLEYLLVGRGSERFLAHAIFGPPDFDQVVSVSLVDRELTDTDLTQDVRVVIPDRKNVVVERLRQGQRVEATLRIGSTPPAKVQLEVGPEIYFEEGELLMP